MPPKHKKWHISWLPPHRKFFHPSTEKKWKSTLGYPKSNCVIQNQIVLFKIESSYSKSDCVIQSQTVLCKIKLGYYSACRSAWRSYKFASLDFSGVFFGVTSWAASHGWYCWHQIAWAHLNTAFNGGICQQNMYFNMYTTKSKPQERSTREDSHAKCFITTNFTAKLWPGAVNRGELWVCFQCVFLSSSAVFPFKILHIDQTHILLNYLYKTHFLICK